MADKKYPAIGEIETRFEGRSLNYIIRHFCGQKIGRGIYRTVYVLKQNPNYVIKIVNKKKEFYFPNVAEWLNFYNSRFTPLVKWLAPVEFINLSGSVLVQQRANWKGKKKGDYPKKLPVELADHKYTNYGWIEGRFVCFDYTFLNRRTTAKKERIVRWRTPHYRGTKKAATLEDSVKFW